MNKINTINWNSQEAVTLDNEACAEICESGQDTILVKRTKFDEEVNWEHDVWLNYLYPMYQLMIKGQSQQFNGYFINDMADNDLFPMLVGKVHEIFSLKGFPDPDMFQVDTFLMTGNFLEALHAMEAPFERKVF